MNLAERAAFSQDKLQQLRARIAKLPRLRDAANLSLYVTGSLGRMEAGPNSDLDVFYMHTGSSSRPLSQLQKIEFDAGLINIARELALPEFSDDGRFLEIHYAEDMRASLGSPEDDASNAFTARMLLLLESQPLFNDGVYQSLLKGAIETYLRDYHDHAAQFRPLFLVNDILRFWKTLCLNYEHKRNRPPSDIRRERAMRRT